MKWATNDEDVEDFEQEKAIKKWLSESGAGEFEFKHINRNGNARNTLIKAAFSLDQEIQLDGTGTFADLVVGSDGRDLICGPVVDETPEDPGDKISGYLFAIGFNVEDVKWIKKLQLSIQINNWRSEKFQTDSEW